MAYLLFTLYFIAGCFIIYRLRLLRDSGLPVQYWILFFCIKVAAGCFYGYWYSLPKNIATSDTWRFHHQALEEYQLLLNHPTVYLVNIFANGEGGGIFSTRGYWNNLKDNIMLKLISMMDLISGGHYYVNVAVFSFITFFGFVYFYLACKIALHRTPSYLTAIAILFTPSCLFWTSGIHRDGFMLLFIGLVMYCVSRILYLKPEKGRWKTILVLPFSLVALFFIRNYVAILALPGLLTLWLVHRYSLKAAWPFCLAAIIGFMFFFLSPYIHPGLNIPARLLERKDAFEQLSGTSRMPALTLKPEPVSFIVHMPQAVDHAVLRPYPWQAKSIMEKVAAFEMALIILGITALLFKTNGHIHQDAIHFQWMIIFLAFSIMLVIGYIIPFSGAVVRYRAVFLMLILAASTFRTRENLRV